MATASAISCWLCHSVWRVAFSLDRLQPFRDGEELGRHVKRGEKAITLCRPVTVKRTTSADDGTEETAAATWFVYRPLWFVLAQTDGKALPPTTAPKWDATRALAALDVQEIEFAALDGNTLGYAQGRTIAVNPVNPLPHKTRFHELAHVLLGHTAEGEQHDGELTPRNLRECEAESVALLCCAALELPGIEYSRGYIQNWWGKGNPIPEKSAQRILKAADSEGWPRAICSRRSGGGIMPPLNTQRAAVYARVSTSDQTCENQLLELRRYCEARGWQAAEYVDTGISGAKDKRPALDVLLKDAKRRRFDVLVCWRLDRLGRNLRHLVTMLEDLNHVGVAFVSLGEGIDCTTPAGKLQLHVLAALSEFERARIAERVRAGLSRVKAAGRRLGRPERQVAEAVLAPVRGLSVREAAKRLGVSPATAHRWLSQKTSPESTLRTQ